MICSSQSCSPLMMQCPMCYLHFTLAIIPPNVKSEYAEKATPSICMIYQTVDKVMKLLLLKGISILHIITFILMLHWYSVICESNLTLPIARFFGLQKSNMPYIVAEALPAIASYLTMTKVRRVWRGMRKGNIRKCRDSP